MKTSNPVVAYFRSAFEELGKVTWPTREQAAMLTGIVVVVSLLMAVFLGLLDLGFSQGYQELLKVVPESTSSVVDNGAGVSIPADGIEVTTAPDSTDSSDSSSQQ